MKRVGGRNVETLDALGFSDADALAEIVSLRLTEFKGIAWEKGRAADEYLKRIQGQMITSSISWKTD